MIEPHSAQLGASSWILNATLVAPRDRVIAAGLPPPLPLVVWPLACPFEAMTASGSWAAAFGASTTAGSAATAVALGASAGGSDFACAGEPEPPFETASSIEERPSSAAGARAE